MLFFNGISYHMHVGGSGDSRYGNWHFIQRPVVNRSFIAKLKDIFIYMYIDKDVNLDKLFPTNS